MTKSGVDIRRDEYANPKNEPDIPSWHHGYPQQGRQAYPHS